MFSHHQFTICILSGSYCHLQLQSHLPLSSTYPSQLFNASRLPSCPTRLNELVMQVLSAPLRLPTKMSFTAQSSNSPWASPGHINFFIPSNKWGIELLRDGSKLAEHSRLSMSLLVDHLDPNPQDLYSHGSLVVGNSFPWVTHSG